MSSKTKDVVPFIQYAVQGFVDQLDLQIQRIREYQHAVVWKDYVYDRFHDKRSPAAHRQRQLAIELGRRRGLVLVRKVTRLTTELAEAYAGKTQKTVTRDLNALGKMGLIARHGRAVSAKTEALRAFLPSRRPAASRQ